MIDPVNSYNSTVKSVGDIEAFVEYKDGFRFKLEMPNTVLATGRSALAKSLVNDVGTDFSFYVNRMIFGDNGTNGGEPKYVDAGRNGLFGLTVVSKPVIASVDPNVPTQAIFTSVISYSEANGSTLNEMALQMANGDLYSMRTFPDLNKTSQMQIVWNWRINYS